MTGFSTSPSSLTFFLSGGSNPLSIEMDSRAQSTRATSSLLGGIDWNLFKDGEEDDTLEWLSRTSATPAETAPPIASNSNVPGTDALPLDDINMDDDSGLLDLGDDAPIKQETIIMESDPFTLAQQLQPPQQSDDADNEGEATINSATTGKRVRSRNTLAPPSSSAMKGKRPLKRKKASASGSPSSSTGVQDVDVDDDGNVLDKKQERRVKNLASVREFRKRKMKQLEQNEERLLRLEAENLELKMQLKIGKEAMLSEQREKQQIKEQMREMLQRGASEQEIAHFLNMYKVTYSDYGPKRREKLHFHLARIRELLLPTQVTKLCLYSVEQGKDMKQRDHVIKEDPTAVPDPGTAPISLWGILASELGVTEAQQQQLLERRAAITKVRDDLNHTLGIVKKLEDVTDEKNTALEAQVAHLQQILTPSQATKFIIWVKENQAFMYMLDKLVDATLFGAGNQPE